MELTMSARGGFLAWRPGSVEKSLDELTCTDRKSSLEHQVVLIKAELRLELALRMFLSFGGALLQELPPLLQVDRLLLVHRHHSPAAAGSARHGRRVGVPPERATGSTAGGNARRRRRWPRLGRRLPQRQDVMLKEIDALDEHDVYIYTLRLDQVRLGLQFIASNFWSFRSIFGS